MCLRIALGTGWPKAICCSYSAFNLGDAIPNCIKRDCVSRSPAVVHDAPIRGAVAALTLLDKIRASVKNLVTLSLLTIFEISFSAASFPLAALRATFLGMLNSDISFF